MLWDTFLPLASLPLAVPFPCKMCQLRVSQVWGSVQFYLDAWRQSGRWDKDLGFGPQGSVHRVAPGRAPSSNGSADRAAEAGDDRSTSNRNGRSRTSLPGIAWYWKYPLAVDRSHLMVSDRDQCICCRSLAPMS